MNLACCARGDLPRSLVVAEVVRTLLRVRADRGWANMACPRNGLNGLGKGPSSAALVKKRV